jgi:hypothetical protein
MRVYITKYWNTKGIILGNARTPTSSKDKYVYTVPEDGSLPKQLKLGRDAFKTKNDAIVHCNIEVQKKIRKVEAELHRYKRMKFDHDQLKGFPPRKGIYE